MARAGRPRSVGDDAPFAMPAAPSAALGAGGRGADRPVIGHVAGRVTSPVLVGRDSERAILTDALDRAGLGRSSIVLVGGEAGAGKTRLVSELVVRARERDASVLQGAAISLGGDEGLPFAPIAQALRGLLRERGPEAIATLIDPGTSELGSLVPELGPAAEETGVSRPDWAQTRLFGALLTLLLRLAENGPTVLVVEDLHWADRSTRDVLAFVSRGLVDSGIVIVV